MVVVSVRATVYNKYCFSKFLSFARICQPSDLRKHRRKVKSLVYLLMFPFISFPVPQHLQVNQIIKINYINFNIKHKTVYLNGSVDLFFFFVMVCGVLLCCVLSVIDILQSSQNSI